jgi:hypothetical protein
MAATTRSAGASRVAAEDTPSRPHPRARPRAGAGPDRASVMMFALAAFLVVLALLAGQLSSAPARSAPRPVIVLKHEYRTKIIETIGGSGPGGTSVSQSVSGSGASYAPSAAPTTRAS